MSTNAIKHDSDKPRPELIDAAATTGMARVLAWGAKKYDDHNWRKGFKWSRLLGSAFRHLLAFAAGEDLDPESNLPHLDHAACCVMMLSAHQKHEYGNDDRAKTFVPPRSRRARRYKPRRATRTKRL